MLVNERGPEPESGARSTPQRDAAQDTANPGHKRLSRAWKRRLRLVCGCTESCRCTFKAHPSPKRVDGYRSAVEHLARHQLHAAALAPECRQLWRRGGSDRELADAVVRRWTA